MRPFAILTALVLAPASVMAQEYDAQMHSGATAAAGQVAVMEDMRDGRRAVTTPRAGGQRLSASAVATCRNKARAARTMGRDHPKVKRLYALCARAGY